MTMILENAVVVGADHARDCRFVRGHGLLLQSVPAILVPLHPASWFPHLLPALCGQFVFMLFQALRDSATATLYTLAES